jgi:hypothetical protein
VNGDGGAALSSELDAPALSHTGLGHMSLEELTYADAVSALNGANPIAPE